MQIKITQEVLDLVKEHPDKDSLLYFYSNLNIKQAYSQSTNVFLWSTLLRKTYGRGNKYRDIINILLDLNVIERIQYRATVGFSWRYHLLVTGENINYTITDKSLIKRVNRIKSFNYSNLPDYIKKIDSNMNDIIICEELYSALVEDGYEVTHSQLNKNLDFENNTIRSNNTGRVFHQLTNLSKRHRRLLGHKSGQIVEIDAKNAQLIFLAQFFNDDEQFIKDSFDGVFYEKLAVEMGITLTPDNRGEFKEKFYGTILFQENKLIVNENKYSKAFKKLYPITFSNLLHLRGDSKKANLLQNKESEFFINNLLNTLVQEGIWTIPVHDAVLVLKDDVEVVLEWISLYSNQFFGKQITTSTTEYKSCPTPFNKCTSGKENIEDMREKRDILILAQNSQGVGQNKNDIKTAESIDKIKKAIVELNQEGIKVTVRSIQAKSGVAKSTVEKHYKSLKNDLIPSLDQDTTEGEKVSPEPQNDIKVATPIEYDSEEDRVMMEAVLKEQLERITNRYNK